jgi:hypothetical protein
MYAQDQLEIKKVDKVSSKDAELILKELKHMLTICLRQKMGPSSPSKVPKCVICRPAFYTSKTYLGRRLPDFFNIWS